MKLQNSFILELCTVCFIEFLYKVWSTGRQMIRASLFLLRVLYDERVWYSKIPFQKSVMFHPPSVFFRFKQTNFFIKEHFATDHRVVLIKNVNV